MPRKIALVGTASSGEMAPYDDPSFEIWGVSGRAKYVTRATRWFELHRLDGEPPGWAAEWRRVIRTWPGDLEALVMMYPEDGLGQKVVQYPTDRVVKRFGTFFMTSSFAWMMAMALDEMVPVGQMAEEGSEISIFGVDMEHGTEYAHQRAGFRHFIDVARLFGITVTRLASGGLSYDPIPYPMWQDDPLRAKMTMKLQEARNNVRTLDESRGLVQTMLAQNKAVLNEIRTMEAMGDSYDRAKRVADLEKTIKDQTASSSNISRDLVGNEALAEEREYWLKYLTS